MLLLIASPDLSLFVFVFLMELGDHRGYFLLHKQFLQLFKFLFLNSYQERTVMVNLLQNLLRQFLCHWLVEFTMKENKDNVEDLGY